MAILAGSLVFDQCKIISVRKSRILSSSWFGKLHLYDSASRSRDERRKIWHFGAVQHKIKKIPIDGKLRGYTLPEIGWSRTARQQWCCRRTEVSHFKLMGLVWKLVYPDPDEHVLSRAVRRNEMPRKFPRTSRTRSSFIGLTFCDCPSVEAQSAPLMFRSMQTF